MKITFLIHDLYGLGGTNRTTLNLAVALAERHAVTIVSVRRHRTEPEFEIDPRLTVVPLVDARPGSDDRAHPLTAEPSTAFPPAEKRLAQYSRLIDQRVEEYLRECDADVIIGTRPGINVYLSRFGPPTALRIAQEHLTYDSHGARLRGQFARFYRRLDALVTITEADAAMYRARMSLPGLRVLAIPNSVPDIGTSPADGTAKVIAAAGRLARGKRYDLLIDAFGDVAAKYPDWTLRIYGVGPEKAAIQQFIDDRGLNGRAVLMGVVSPIEGEFAKASIVASASDAESFGMTLVEAMRCGVPVVSTDCPLGPAEIITDGVDGRLVPKGDRDALAAALLELVADEPARRRMGEAALASAHRYDPDRAVAAYEALFADLAASRRSRAWKRQTARVRHSVTRTPARTLRSAARRLKHGRG
ncbi:glycosyltransferase family 4 protein [Streptomyces sp. NRRL F-5123]|uniref:glycosyltransferase family 4 protein n=1 Tax=Streptomyces sp. NRRL F-5123 TaxID=1463856 RepID=UPI000694F972|nr:glycosyltransferase family 4 protein [Streptomyces sp. NRRL F-5123]